MPIEYCVAETTLRKFVLDTDDEASGFFAITELYSERSSAPPVGEVVGFSYQIRGSKQISPRMSVADCSHCQRGLISVEGVTVSFCCSHCSGLGVRIVQHDPSEAEREKKIERNLDVLYGAVGAEDDSNGGENGSHEDASIRL